MEDTSPASDPPIEGNSSAVDDLRRRCDDLRRRWARVRRWFYFFAFLTPLGCIAPCSLIALIPDRTTAEALLIAAVILPFVGWIGMWLTSGDQGLHTRTLAV